MTADAFQRGDVSQFGLDEAGGGRIARADETAGQVQGWEWGCLAAILGLALALRIVGLNAPLWYDEVLTLTHFVREPWGTLVQDFTTLNNHMFYSLQAKASLAVFGESAWALRLPALLFGMGSLAALWVMTRRMAGKYAALIATLLTAVSYHHVWFTQNARGYTALLFWTTVATLLLAANLKKPSWKIGIAYALCVAAGMYTHLSAGFFFAAHAVVYFGALAWDRARPTTYAGLRDWRPFFAFALAGLFTLIPHLPILTQVSGALNDVSSSTGSSSNMSEWASPLRTLQEVIESLGPLGPIAPIALAGGLGLIVIGAVTLVRRSPLIATIYLVQIPVSLLLLMALSFRIWPRYFFVDIGFVFLAVAAGILAVSQWIAPLARRIALPKWAAPATAVVVATLASGVLLAKNYQQPKQDFAGAVAVIKKLEKPGDVAVSAGLAAEPMKTYFAPAWPTVKTAAELEALKGPGRTVYVVTAFASTIELTNPDVAAKLATEFDLLEKRGGTLGGGSVRIYRSKGA